MKQGAAGKHIKGGQGVSQATLSYGEGAMLVDKWQYLDGETCPDIAGSDFFSMYRRSAARTTAPPYMPKSASRSLCPSGA